MDSGIHIHLHGITLCTNLRAGYESITACDPDDLLVGTLTRAWNSKRAKYVVRDEDEVSLSTWPDHIDLASKA